MEIQKEYRNTKIKNGSIYEWNVNENLLNVIDIRFDKKIEANLLVENIK